MKKSEDLGISDLFKGGHFAVDDNPESPQTGDKKDPKGKVKRERPGSDVRAESDKHPDLTDGKSQPGNAGAGDIEGSHHAKKGGEEENDVEKGKKCEKCGESICKCGSMNKSDGPPQIWQWAGEMHGLSDEQMARDMQAGIGPQIQAPLDKRPR